MRLPRFDHVNGTYVQFFKFYAREYHRRLPNGMVSMALTAHRKRRHIGAAHYFAPLCPACRATVERERAMGRRS